MEKVKYTTDGKKVVVIGKLNSQETIVQEIFISDNSEIPSGEQFVTRSLHDEPVKSWKEINIEKIEARYEKEHKEIENNISKLQKDYNIKSQTIKEKLKFLNELNLKMKQSDFETLIDFVSGDIQFLVIDKYGSLCIEEYNDGITAFDRYGWDDIRLLSLYGARDNGNLNYRMHDYRDGSGSWKQIYPCKTEEEALEKLKELFYEKLQGGLSDTLLATSKKYDLEIPKEVTDKYNASKKVAIEKNIQDHKNSIENYKKELKELKTK